MIRCMVTDLNFDVEIFGHPIVREEDGLAMSSRNSYLDKKERATALCLFESLVMARRDAASGVLDASELTLRIREHILSFSGTGIDYVSFVNKETLEPVDTVDEKTLLALAVRVNNVRLIDNCLIFAEQGIS